MPTDEDGEPQIPDSFGGKGVWQDGDFLVSGTLLPHSDDSVAEFAHGKAEAALDWLVDYGWGRAENWQSIESRVREVLG